MKQDSIPVGYIPPAFLILGVSLHRLPGQRPLEGTWDQAARQEVTSYRDPHLDRMTDASENITLPRTSFAGGNDAIRKWMRE